MILPMTGFFLLLAVLGGITILLSGSNAYAARKIPAAFAMLFAGLCYCILAIGFYLLAFRLGTVTGFVLLFFVPFVAALAGAIVGYRTGQKRMTKETR